MAQGGRSIVIPHLGRVEGHGGIFVKIVGDTVHEVNMDIFEGSRYYEALLKGKHFLEVQGIITRVCAICSANHTVAALTALEKALGVEPVAAHPPPARAAGAGRHHRVARPARVRPGAAGLPGLRLRDHHGGQVPGGGGLRPQAQAARQPHPGAGRRARHPPHQHPGGRLRTAARARGLHGDPHELAAALDPLHGHGRAGGGHRGARLGGPADGLRRAAALRGGLPLPRRAAVHLARRAVPGRALPSTWCASSRSSTRTPSTRPWPRARPTWSARWPASSCGATSCRAAPARPSSACSRRAWWTTCCSTPGPSWSS